MRDLMPKMPGLVSAHPVGKRPAVFKLHFVTSTSTWDKLKSMRGEQAGASLPQAMAQARAVQRRAFDEPACLLLAGQNAGRHAVAGSCGG